MTSTLMAPTRGPRITGAMRNARGVPQASRNARRARRVYDNSNTAMIPQIWARYTLAILESNMVAGQLVFRDFDPLVANFGDTVNTRKPAQFTVYNKTDADAVTVQDASVTNIPVVLNMHPHVTFLIKDGEESLSMESLVELYLQPAVIAMAERMDAQILGMYSLFLGNAGQGGSAFGLTSSTYQKFLTEIGNRLDNTKCPAAGRNLVVNPNTKRLILQNQTLVGANQRGDEGTALRTANIGTIYGFDHFMCQNMAAVSAVDVASSAGLINNGAGYGVGTTVLTVDGFSGAVTTGQWFKLNGKAYQITAHSETLGATTSITIATPGLWDSAADEDAITTYGIAAIDNVAGYAVGWAKAIKIEDATIFPKVGEFVTFKTDAFPYTIVAADSSASTITLNRPLDIALADEDNVCQGIPSDYGFAFHRNAVALVMRPLKLPRAGVGALAGSVSHNGLSMRVVITYDGAAQGHRVTIDTLMGLKQLDSNYGAVLLG